MFAVHTHAKQIGRGAADALRAVRFTTALAHSDGDGLHSCGTRRCFAAGPSFEYEPDYSKKHDIVRKHGVDVLHDPLYNKVCRRMRTSATPVIKLVKSAFKCREPASLTQRGKGSVSEACFPRAPFPWRDRLVPAYAIAQRWQPGLCLTSSKHAPQYKQLYWTERTGCTSLG